MFELLADVLSGVGTGLSTLFLEIIKAVVSGFNWLIYVDPTAEVKEYNAILAWIVLGFTVGITFWIVRKVFSLFRIGKTGA